MAAPLSAQRAERPALDITGYVIDAELDTTAHHLAAKTVVSFTAPANLEVVNFGFHPALKVTKITDESGKLLEGERTADGAIRVTPGLPFVQGQTVHWTFEYEGIMTGAKTVRSKVSSSPPSRSRSAICCTPRAGSLPPAT